MGTESLVSQARLSSVSSSHMDPLKSLKQTVVQYVIILLVVDIANKLTDTT